MHLSPSKILFTNCLELGSLHDLSTDKSILEVSRTIQKGGTYPRLQVVKKDGYYFSLNDTKLHLYRYLEKIGQCGSVQVEKVSLREVPEGILNLMRAPDVNTRPKGKCDKKSKGKYHSVGVDDANHNTTLVTTEVVDANDNDDDDDDDDDDSDCGDTADSSDWSDEEPSATDIDTSADEDETPDENESFI